MCSVTSVRPTIFEPRRVSNLSRGSNSLNSASDPINFISESINYNLQEKVFSLKRLSSIAIMLSSTVFWLSLYENLFSCHAFLISWILKNGSLSRIIKNNKSCKCFRRIRLDPGKGRNCPDHKIHSWYSRIQS